MPISNEQITSMVMPRLLAFLQDVTPEVRRVCYASNIPVEVKQQLVTDLSKHYEEEQNEVLVRLEETLCKEQAQEDETARQAHTKALDCVMGEQRALDSRVMRKKDEITRLKGQEAYFFLQRNMPFYFSTRSSRERCDGELAILNRQLMGLKSKELEIQRKIAQQPTLTGSVLSAKKRSARAQINSNCEQFYQILEALLSDAKIGKLLFICAPQIQVDASERAMLVSIRLQKDQMIAHYDDEAAQRVDIERRYEADLMLVQRMLRAQHDETIQRINIEHECVESSVALIQKERLAQHRLCIAEESRKRMDVEHQFGFSLSAIGQEKHFAHQKLSVQSEEAAQRSGLMQQALLDQQAMRLELVSKTMKVIQALLINQMFGMRWSLFGLFFRSYAKKRAALQNLSQKLRDVAGVTVEQGLASTQTVHDVLEEWKTLEVRTTLATHRTRFFAKNRPTQTDTEKFIDAIDAKYGRCAVKL